MLLSLLFLTYLAFYFLRLHQYSPELTDTNILLVLLALSVLLYLFKRGKNLKSLQTTYIVGFYGAALLSHITFGYFGGLIETFNHMLPLMALYFIASALLVDLKRIELYFGFLCICAIVMSIYGIDQHYDGMGWTGVPVHPDMRLRYLSIFHDPNDLGMFLIITIPFFLYFYKKSSNVLLKLLQIPAIGLILFAVYLTDSRGTFLAMLAMLGLYGWKHLNRILTIILMSAVVPIAFLATRLSTISAGESSAAGRLEAWVQGVYMLRSDPLFGVGYRMFREHHHISAHSSYVEIFAETGLIGYYFWLGWVTLPVYVLYKYVYQYNPVQPDIKNMVMPYKRIATVMMYALIAFLASAFFISRGTQSFLFVLTGISAGLITFLQHNSPGYKPITLRDSFKPCIILTVSSVFLIYMSIKIFR